MIFNGRITDIGLVEVVEPPGHPRIRLDDQMTEGVSTLHLRNGLPHREDGPAIICRYGSTYWCREGLLHREGGPAVECSDGSTYWYLHGLRHRADGPAVEHWRGSREWFCNCERHRDDGPAVENSAGYREWHRNGVPHRDDGPAIEYPDGARKWAADGRLVSVMEEDGSRCWCPGGTVHREQGPAVVLADGTRLWCRDGELHRADGPALETPHRTRIWLSHGRRHRVDGPAVERASGDVEWWVDGGPVPAPDHAGGAAPGAATRTHCAHLQNEAPPGTYGGGGTGDEDYGMCGACRRAVLSLIGEADFCRRHGSPHAYQMLDKICDVLTAMGLEDAAAQAILALMSWRCGYDWADSDADVWVTPVRLRHTDDRQEPAGLRDLGAIPVVIEGLFPDQTLEDDEQVVVYTFRVPARICPPGAPASPATGTPS